MSIGIHSGSCGSLCDRIEASSVVIPKEDEVFDFGIIPRQRSVEEYISILNNKMNTSKKKINNSLRSHLVDALENYSDLPNYIEYEEYSNYFSKNKVFAPFKTYKTGKIAMIENNVIPENLPEALSELNFHLIEKGVVNHKFYAVISLTSHNQLKKEVPDKELIERYRPRFTKIEEKAYNSYLRVSKASVQVKFPVIESHMGRW